MREAYKSNKIVTNSNNLNFIEMDNELIALIAEHRIINFFNQLTIEAVKYQKILIGLS